MITNEIYFFKNQSSVSTSGSLYNVNDGTLILQVDGDVSNLELSVLGNTDLVDDDFVTLKTINASDYNMSDKITSTGIYWIDINGIRKIKLNLSKITGSVNVKAITKRGLTTDLVARAMAANSAGGGSYTLPIASASTLGGIKVGENLTIDENGVLSAGGGEPEMYVLEFSGDYNPSYQYNATDNDKIRIAELITTLKEDASVPIYVKFKNGYGLLFTPLLDIQPGQQTNYFYQCIRYNNTNIRTLWLCSLNIYGTWENDIFTVSMCFVSTDTNGFLSTGTQYGINDGFNPTLDQHPATKKYVDDAVASAGGGTEALPIYNVECDISNGPSPNWYDSSSDFATLTKKAINEAYNKGDLHFILNYGSSSNDLGTTLQVVAKIYNTNRPISFNTIPEISYMGGTYKEQLISLSYASWVYTDGEWTYPTGNVGAQFVSDVPFMTNSSALSTFLSKTNTKSYTPTNDYNPATKKYVDDTIAAAITTSLEGSY